MAKICFDEIYVRKLLHNINAQKATGYDNIPPKMVKMCADGLSVTLTELLNYAFSNKIFPDDMKKAEISPFFKKNDDLAKDKYRPISILVVFSKVFETIIAEHLMEYFISNSDNMLCAHRKKYGTRHVLIKLINSWKYALDNHNFVSTISIDLSNAFGLLDIKMNVYRLSRDAVNLCAVI